jgi:hypothetical protein
MSAMRLSAPLTEAWRTVVPAADDPHRPLPPLLLGLTVVTGLVETRSATWCWGTCSSPT